MRGGKINEKEVIKRRDKDKRLKEVVKEREHNKR